VTDRRNGLSIEHRRAVNLLAGAKSDVADVAGCDSEAVAEWLQDVPEFIARLNRAKSFRRERLRAGVLSLASDAMATLRELVSGPDVPPSVRLRASLAILQTADALKVEERCSGSKTLGATVARGSHWSRLLRSRHQCPPRREGNRCTARTGRAS
jgi:hypothetical protein